MATETQILQDQIITGPLFNEPMRVVTVKPNGPDSVEAGLEGLETSSFWRVTLTSSDIASLKITEPHPTFDGDGNLLRLGLQAYSMGIAHEFDPYFGLSISRVDPLPHQLEAVYEYFMKLPSVRFLLADDAGAGKTIMAGLLVRELTPATGTLSGPEPARSAGGIRQPDSIFSKGRVKGRPGQDSQGPPARSDKAPP